MRSITYTHEPEKIYFSVEEVAQKLRVPAYTIRFWERQFHVEVKRNKMKRRFYDKENISQLHSIQRLLQYFTHNGLHKIANRGDFNKALAFIDKKKSPDTDTEEKLSGVPMKIETP